MEDDSEIEKPYKYYDLKNTLEFHTSDVCTLTPLSSNIIASAGGDKIINLIHINNEKVISTLKGHRSTVLSSTLLHNGCLATGSVDGSIKIWDLETESLRKTIEMKSVVRCLCLLANGDLVAGSEDSSIKIFSEKDLSLKKTFKSHKLAIYDMALLPDGLPDLVTASADKKIIIWNSRTGIDVSEIRKHSNWVRAVHVLKTGKLISSSFDRTIRIWNPQNGNCLHKIESVDPILTCSFANLLEDSFACASGNAINIFSNETYQFKNKLVGHSKTIWCLKTLSNGDLASGSADKTIKIWSLRSD